MFKYFKTRNISPGAALPGPVLGLRCRTTTASTGKATATLAREVCYLAAGVRECSHLRCAHSYLRCAHSSAPMLNTLRSLMERKRSPCLSPPGPGRSAVTTSPAPAPATAVLPRLS